VLGVTSDASERDIKKAFRQKALKLHPDVNKAVRAPWITHHTRPGPAVVTDWRVCKQRTQWRRIRCSASL
jgi:hypothetical protein